MREIKFRAWDAGINNKGQYWSWESLLKHNLLKESLTNKSIICELYTGLSDKDGEEIYEGDIIRDSTFKDHGSYIMSVEWEDEAASFVLTRKGWAFRHYFMESSDPKDCEVIGNIHENPELLNESL